MKTILLLNASPHGQNSRAYRLARKAAGNVMAIEPALKLVERDLARHGTSAVTRHYAEAITSPSPSDPAVFDESESLIREVEACSYLIVSTPMHNFTVPASLKLWIDCVLRARRTFTVKEGMKVGLLEDRPTLVLVSSGGLIIGSQARQPDFLSAYFTHVLATLGIRDVNYVYLQGLSRPEIAEQSLATADEQIAADRVFGLPSPVI